MHGTELLLRQSRDRDNQTQEFEDRFLVEKKVAAVFVNLTAAYNTV